MSNIFHFPHSKCWLCVVIPVALSGIVGFLAGNISSQLGLSTSASSSIAGFAGFMGAQAFNFACLLLTTRYRKHLLGKSECTRDMD